MLVADTRLGHRDDAAVADRLAATDPHRVVLSDVERRRSRVRTETTDGRDLGVVVAPDLADGDVLETECGVLVVVELAAVEALVVPVGDCDPAAALELGHALGNRHLDLAVRDGEALIPTDGPRPTVESVVEEVLPDANYQYREVGPTTFDDEDHGQGNDHSHEHGDHSQEHEHQSHDNHTHEHHHAGDGENDPLAGPRAPNRGDEP